MKLTIPSTINHNDETYKLHGITTQKRKALRLARKLEKESNHFRIKFINSKYCVYKQCNKKEK